MIHPRNEFTNENAVLDNIARYKRRIGHEPCFTLTPTGAQKLKEFLATQEIDLNEKHGVNVKLLRNYFNLDASVTNKNTCNLDAPIMHALLGTASEGYDADQIFIDPRALNALAETKQRGR